MAGKICFGIDVGGTTIKCGMFRTDGTVLDKWEIPTRTENGGEQILPDIAAAVHGRIQVNGFEEKQITGIGIGIPGPVRAGKVPVAVNLHWGEKDVAKELEALTGFPVRVANDANAAALGEMWKGAGEGRKNVIMITLGTGVGCGVIINEQIVEGANGAGGEVGHMHVSDDLDEPCNGGNKGCLEQFCSATGIARLARVSLAEHPETESVLRDGKPDAKAVFDAYKEGDALAESVVREFADLLGTALSSVAVVTDPEVIVIGGGVSKAGEVLTDIVGRYYRQKVFSSCAGTPVVLAKLGNDAGIYGAARMVI